MQQIKGGRFFFEYTQYVQFNFIVLQLPYTIRHWPNSGNTSKYHLSVTHNQRYNWQTSKWKMCFDTAFCNNGCSWACHLLKISYILYHLLLPILFFLSFCWVNFREWLVINQESLEICLIHSKKILTI